MDLAAARALVTLTPMTLPDYRAFMGNTTPLYLAERATADHISLARAAEFVRAQHARVLPEGHLTEQHTFRNIVAAKAREIVGGLWLFVDLPQQQAFLYNIVVWREQRRRGYAGAALVLAEELVRSAGCETLSLNVFATNPGAQALYTKLGYAVVSSHMNKRL